jgi:diguanylate cyclase (GGDEF)-like protein/PAS domain S-box-containing protein
MMKPLRVLLVEDAEDDAALLLRELRRGGFEPSMVRVQTAEAMKAELLARPWDVVISDFSLPSFSGLEALAVLQGTGMDVPFLLVSGTIGEEVAVEAMRAGADDYVMKAQLQRLPAAVERELREAEARAAHREAQKTLIALRKAVDSLPVGVTITGTDGTILFTNPAEHILHGYPPDELLGKEGRSLMPPEFARPLSLDQMRNLRSWKRERLNVRKDGSVFPAQLISDVVLGAGGEPLGIVTICEDISERKLIEQQMFRHAFYDDLTGLPNRALFLERLGRAVARARGRSESTYAVLYLDLDRFKLVNDGLGHHIGNQLLVAIARRLEQCLRPADTVARLGGDEFTILVDDLKDAEGATQLAERVQVELTSPFSLAGHQVYTSASIGIAVSTHGYHRHEEVLRDADIAMYRAKALGKARYEMFDSAMHQHAVSLLKLETDLRRAVEHDEITVHYQPIVSLTTGEVTGFEALARWRHPQRGIVLPDEFIPLAEETGLILSLGPSLLREACREVAQLRDGRLTVSVNLSARQLADDGLLEGIDEALAGAGLAASRLKLEVTESAIMSNAEAAIAVLRQLRTRGVGIQIDDFGTGYSSLSYLQKLPVDTLKIDRSFVSRIDDAGEKAEIVESIIALARSLDLDVIAEGIETERQLARLRMLRCDGGQGFLLSKAIPVEALRSLPAGVRLWTPSRAAAS